MRRLLNACNFVGVVALAVLLAAQWHVNSQLNLRADELDRDRQQQTQKVAEQDKTIKANAADMEDLRGRLERADAATKDVQSKLNAANEQIAKLTSEYKQIESQRDQLKDALDKWRTAVSDRDQALKDSSDRLQKLATERDDAVKRFNDLATRYNETVKELNAKAKG